MQIVNINGFDKVLLDHDDVNAAVTIGYGCPFGEPYLYKDRNLTKVFTLDEMIDAYLKGLRILLLSNDGNAGGYLTPIAIELSGGALLVDGVELFAEGYGPEAEASE